MARTKMTQIISSERLPYMSTGERLYHMIFKPVPLWFVRFHKAAKFALALLVLVGTLVGAYERSLDAGFGGIAGLFCPPQHLASNQLMTGTLGFFLYIFHLSTYVELVDAFIWIAEGHGISFLMCYHHLSMVVVTWSWFAFPWLEGAWWCAVVNSIINSFVYYSILRTNDTSIFHFWLGKYLPSAHIFKVCFQPLFLCNFVSPAYRSVHLGLHWHCGGRVRFRPRHVLRRQAHGNLHHSRRCFYPWPSFCLKNCSSIISSRRPRPSGPSFPPCTRV